MSNVTVDQPALSIYQSLNDKLLELRAKRDAISLHHEELKAKNDMYNKVIIVMSLSCAFVETTKMQMGLKESLISRLAARSSPYQDVFSTQILAQLILC